MNRSGSAGGVIVNPQGKLLLVEQHGNSWCFPKGHLEEGESALDAARREIAEETGLANLALVEELGSYERRSIGKDGIGENTQWPPSRRTLFLFRAPDATIPGGSDPDGEITAAQWVSPEEALALLTHPKDREFLASVLESIREAVQ